MSVFQSSVFNFIKDEKEFNGYGMNVYTVLMPLEHYYYWENKYNKLVGLL